MKKLSIIIPVYNAEQYLNRCLDSVCNQSYQNLEIILINDGSTDSSERIILNYQERDSRIKYFSQDNQGVSSARNNGLSHATGEYITFLDADDWIELDTYRMIMDSSNDSDIIIIDVFETDGINKKHNTLDFNRGIINRNEITFQMLESFAGAAWRGVFRKPIVEGIIFPLGLPLSEDKVFCIKCFAKCESITYLKEPLYYRFERKNSAVNLFRKDMLEVQIHAYLEIKHAIDSSWSSDFSLFPEKYLVDHLRTIVLSICDKRNNNSVNEKLKHIRVLLNNSYVKESLIKYTNSEKNEIISSLIRKKQPVSTLIVGYLILIKNKIGENI